MRVSVIVPCRNEERYIGLCLDSILATTYPRDDLEVLVVDGRSDDRTREVVARYAERRPWIRLLDNPRRVVPAALNLGIRAATGEVVVRMDAHVLYPRDYISKLVEALASSGAENVGGRVVTVPADTSATARGIAAALSHPFGVGNSYFRIGAARPRWVDTVPFGCYRRDVFRRLGLFDEELVRNQDDEFNHRVIKSGGRVLLRPDVVAHYFARGSYRQLARMYYQYGYFKPLASRKVGRVMTLRQLVPPAFVLGMSGLALAAPLWSPAAAAAALVAALYASAALICAAKPALAHGARCALALAAAFPVIHVSYGFGFLRGAWDLALAARARRADPAAVPLSR
jgi:glycosyltransferase involved in cell wall biosynthesis